MARLPKEIVLTLPGFPDPALAIAASRAGALGVLDLEYVSARDIAESALARIEEHTRTLFGVRLDADDPDYLDSLLPLLPDRCGAAILTGTDAARIESAARALREGRSIAILIEARDASVLDLALRLGAGGIVAKGHEAGGRVGDETSFILLQRLLALDAGLPLWVQGGIGLHTAAACATAGAAGIVLDWQLALTREGVASIPEPLRARLAAMDGSETLCLGAALAGDAATRLYARPGLRSAEALQEIDTRLQAEGGPDAGRTMRDAVARAMREPSPGDRPWLTGQDAAFAARIASRFVTAGGAIEGIRRAIDAHAAAARRLRPLDEDSPLARSHGTRYPILQGPMTRVSDVAPFAQAVADGGALPFLALALMRGAEVRTLLEETRERFGGRAWGVGILGFVPLELRKEQLEAIREARPPFALIAGGRPDQALALEREGITTYLHVPSPGLLEMFLADGARRFVFEGRECGGHVGPRSSFVLWETMVELLLRKTPAGEFEKLHVIFAGGIHDARSAAMVATLAAPLAEAGAKLGVLLGTAYLFTDEAVSSGAIQPGFQEEALACRRTVLLETGPGHATRCVDTAFAREFLDEKRRLLAQGQSAEEIRDALEMLNLGRLRIASKGITHVGGGNGGPPVPRHARVGDAEQRRQGMYMIGQVAELRHDIVPVASLHRDVSVGSSAWLSEHARARRDPDAVPPAPSDIAIVGMGCLLPKAGDLRTFWENVLAKRDAITEIPPDRWDWRLYFDEDRKAPDRIYSRWGGFLEDIPFDPLAYGMPPSTLASIEPMQLLTLEVSRAALSDAGYLDREFNREKTSVIFGAGGGLADLGAQYAIRSHLPMVDPDAGPEAYARLPKWTEDSFAGILPNVAAGRVANRFDLGGVNFTVDAACASSLAAVHLAVRELETGNSDMVIVGGADTMQNPFTYLCFAKTQALSPHGRCRTFDTEADGIVISEGLVALVLKRLDDAERDGDRVYAVIKGVGGSSDGRDRGLTAPRPEGQMRALERAYAKAGFSPATVGLFEAHGTGTVAGDLAEAQSLTRVLEAEGAKPGSCAVGSVKSMIGHTKCSAGVAGLMKIALALHDRILPPTINVERPNPKSGFGTGPLYVNAETRPWIRPADHPRRAGVSAFGFGGTNFHAVLEEYEGDFLGGEEKTLRRWPSELLAWSGTDRAGILAQIEPYLRAADPATPHALADLACTAATALRARRGREAALTLAVVADSKEDLAAKLGRAAERLRAGAGGRFEDPRGIYFSDRPLAADGRVAFLFPGQGSQRPDMLRELAVHFPEVRAAFERADVALAEKLGSPLSALVFPRPRFTKEEEQAAMEAITDTRVAQPALGAAGSAMIALLDRLGVRPDMAAGHSYGEYVALYAAGRIDEAALFSISEARGRAIAAASDQDLGTMAAVDAPAARVEEALRGIKGVVVANCNSPKQTIISGTREAVQKALGRMEELDLLSRSIRVACAFHSPLMAPARDCLAKTLSMVRLADARCQVWSNTLAGRYPDDPAAALALLVDHLVKPVRFQEEIEAMHAAGARVFVEAGPGSVLTGLTRQILDGREFAAVALDNGKRAGLLQLQHALAQLLAQGVPVAVDGLFEARDLIPLDPASLMAEGKVPSRPVWLVNGSRVRPANEARPSAWVETAEAIRTERTRPAPRHAPATPAPGPTAEPLRPREFEMTRHDDEAPTTPARVSPPGGDRAAVMLHHQQLMARFLETQRSVMLAFLEGASAPAELGAGDAEAIISQPLLEPIAVERPAVAARPASPAAAKPRAVVPPVRPSAPAPSGNGARPAISLEDVTSKLLAIVSERTGYPPDMLDLDLDLEADLGIDSIKRVEILGTFQAWDALAGWKADEEFMEKVRTLKSLRSIAGLLADTLSGGGPEAPSPPGPVAGPPRSGGGNGAAPRGNGHDQEGTGVMDHAGNGQSPEAQQAQAEPPVPGGAEEGRIAPAPVFAIREVTSSVDGEGSATAPALPAGAIVITDDEDGVADAMGRALIDLGARAVVIRLDDAIEDQLARVRGTQGPIGAVIHLAPLAAAPAFDDLDLEAWRARVGGEVKSLAALLRLAASDLKDAAARGNAFVLAATADAASNPHRGAIAGLLKCLAWEWPAVRCRAVDLDPADAATQVRRILSELAAPPGPDVASAWRGGRRVVFRPVAAPVERTNDPIDSAAVVLVTGGARGITAAIARTLAERAKPTIVLLGRSPLPPEDEPPDLASAGSPAAVRTALLERAKIAGARPTPRAIEAEIGRTLGAREIRENLRAMRGTGARIVYRQADARDASALGAVIEETYATYGRIDGVIHGAGVIEDKLLEEKSPESFDRVFDTKADSAFLLARMLRPEGLRFLVFMSSVTGAFGNRGQADYGAANEVLNHLAAFLDRRWEGRVVALNWGPWDAVGMAGEEVKRQFAERGVRVIPPAAGCEALLAEIGAPKARGSVLVIGDGPWRDLPGGEAASAETLVTPLLHRERLVPGRGGEMECLRVLDPAFDRYLHHHRLDGKPVLPAAAGLALMAEAAQKAWPDLVVTGARDVRVLRGITLAQATFPIRIAVRPKTHAPSEASDAIEAAVEITEPGRPDRACYRATILLGARLTEGPAARHPFLATLPPYPIPIGDAYRKWLFHGPVFQCVRRVLGVSEEGILSEIAPSRPSSCLEGTGGAARWTIDPVLVDGCLQLALLWVRAIHDMTGLPSRLRAVRRYAFDPAKPLTVSLRVLEGSGEANVRSDILCLTPEGRTALAIDGFEFTCAAALNRLVGWDESLLPPSERGRP